MPGKVGLEVETRLVDKQGLILENGWIELDGESYAVDLDFLREGYKKEFGGDHRRVRSPCRLFYK